MIKLERVPPQSLTATDIEWLLRACYAVKFEHFDAVNLVREAIENKLLLYRIVGGASGMLAVRLHKEDLFLEAFGGEHILENFDEIYDRVKALAKEFGRRRISTMVSRPAVHRLYNARTNARQVAVLFAEDLT